MANYKVIFVGDDSIKNIHHIGVNHNGNYYSVIFGKYINGGFFCIPNWDCGGELAAFNDVLWNADSIGKQIGNGMVGTAIANAIADFAENLCC